MALSTEVRNLEGAEARILAAKQLLSSGRISQAQVLLTEAVDMIRHSSAAIVEAELPPPALRNEEAMIRLIDLLYHRFENQ